MKYVCDLEIFVPHSTLSYCAALGWPHPNGFPETKKCFLTELTNSTVSVTASRIQKNLRRNSKIAASGNQISGILIS